MSIPFSIPFAIACLLVTIILLFSYFSKNRVNYIENKIFSFLLVFTFIGLGCEIVSYILTVCEVSLDSFLYYAVTKTMMLYYATWTTAFLFYVYVIGLKDHAKINYAFVKVISILYIVAIALIALLPVSHVVNNNTVFPEGFSVNICYLYFALCFVIMIALLIKNVRNLKNKQYLPVLALLILGTVVVVVQGINPQIMLLTCSEALITFIMYFSIENPDLLMVEELNRNKELLEKTNMASSNFMFKITSDSRQYLKKLLTISEKSLEERNVKALQESMHKIYEVTKEAENKLNNIIDVSAIDVKNIKISNEEYNFNQLIDQVRLQFSENLSSNINFNVNIAQNIPEKLYGDSIRLKQIIYALLSNFASNMEKGYINLDISTIIKYDVCRLIISVENSNSDIDLTEVNDILSLDDNISDEEIKHINDLDIDLKLMKKLIKLLGGTLLVTNDSNVKITIVLDQVVATKSHNVLEDKMSKYNQSVNAKNIIVVDDDLTELNQIEGYFNEEDINGLYTVYSDECVRRVTIKQKFNLIILDDEMKEKNAINILKELQKNAKFKTPVIVMLDEKKLSISKHYLADGFADFIDKSRLDAEIKRVVNKYLK